MRRPNLLLILLITIALHACKKGSTKPAPTPSKTTDVYVVGYDQDNAVYWKNGKETILNKTAGGVTFKSAEAYALTINNNDIYVVGTGKNSDGSTSALIWKNGVPATLSLAANNTGAATGSRALSIAISGNDIYIGGDADNSAVLWKNGVATTFGSQFDSFSTILLSGPDVFAAGCREASNADLFPTYFKNGSFASWHEPHLCWIHDIGVVDTNVYVVGSEFLTPCYWKNGERMPLGSPAAAGELSGIAIAGKDIYMVGYTTNEATPFGVLWKNDAIVFSGRNGSSFSRIAVNNADTYIIGDVDTSINSQKTTIATIWKNKLETKLSSSSSNAYGIYIH